VSAKRAKKFKSWTFAGIPAIAALLALIVFISGMFSREGAVTVLAKDLMEGIKAEEPTTVELKAEFIQSTADFSVELFKNSYAKRENSLISPTSVYFALGMTANGAKGNTLKEFEELLGKEGIGIEDLNSYYYSLSKWLTDVKSGKVTFANSIWYRDDDILNIKKEFLQKNASYYKAAAYKADFSAKATVKDINNWVKHNTGETIDKIIDKIDGNDLMYLINAVYFEDKWETPYTKQDIQDGEFYLEDGTRKKVEFMNSTEFIYISDDKAEGFIKPYESGKYSFVAILPNEGVGVDSYIASLSGEKFISLMDNKSSEKVRASIPKFKISYSKELKESLKNMGLVECFSLDKADFSEMAEVEKGDIYVGKVLHKTYITVDVLGTKAGAATSANMQLKLGAPEGHDIILDRPFIYAIIDNETNLPLFIGTMMNPKN